MPPAPVVGAPERPHGDHGLPHDLPHSHGHSKPRVAVLTYSSHLCHGCAKKVTPKDWDFSKPLALWDALRWKTGASYFASSEQNHLIRKNHAQYAACHGYAYLSPHTADAHPCYAEMLPIARLVAVPAWAKLPLLQNCLKHFDWLVWLDGDVVIRNHSVAVHDLVTKYDQQCGMLVAEDIVEQENLFNSGVMLLRGGKENPWASHFLHEVMTLGWDMQQERFAGWHVSRKVWDAYLSSTSGRRNRACESQNQSIIRGRQLWEQRAMHSYFWSHANERCRFCIVSPAGTLQAMIKHGHPEEGAFAVHFTEARRGGVGHVREVVTRANETCARSSGRGKARGYIAAPNGKLPPSAAPHKSHAYPSAAALAGLSTPRLHPWAPPPHNSSLRGWAPPHNGSFRGHRHATAPSEGTAT